MGTRLRVFSKKIVLSVTAFILAVSSITAALPFVMGQEAGAINSSSAVVYDALPSVSPQTNYPSQPFQAQQVSEFGDYIKLGGSNRVLDSVTVTMSTWARYSEYSANTDYNSSGWSLPITVNIYGDQFNSNGAPTNRIASVEKTINIPWRPEGDSSCPNTGYGAGFAWKAGDGTCKNGLAFNAIFDLSSLKATLPDDIVVSFAYNTETYGAHPTHVSGPYNSLNIAIPSGQGVSVGSDNSTSAVVINAASNAAGAYGDTTKPYGIFRTDTGWSPYGTVAMQITATAPLAVVACTTTSTLNSTSLSGWYLGETRTAGHNELMADGLQVWTDPSGGSYTNEFSKAAGYYTTDFALADAGIPDITIASGYTGTRPSLQLGVDKDGNGTWDGYLVYEPWAYGTGNFWSSKNFGIGSGMGYTSFGTLNDYLNANPNARVTSIGYSLGSGVVGNAKITKITAGCTNYTFGLAAPTNLTPSNGTITNDPAFVDTWSAVEGAHGYEYRTANTLNGSALGTIIYSDSTTNQPGRYSTNSGTVTRQNSGTPDGDYYWQVRAVDSTGNPGPWSAINKVSVDSAAPAVPIHLSPANNALLNYNNFWFDWTDVAGAVSYEAQFSQSSSTDSNGSLNVGVWSGDASHNQPTDSRAWSSGATGTWYWQVRAVDAVGNKSAWSTPWKITLDLIAPAAVTLSSPANGAVVNGASVTQSWNASASSDVDHYIYESYNDANATSLRWSQTVNGLSKTATNVANATYWWRVKAVDAAGNESAWSPLWKLTIDNDAPGAPVTTSAKPYYTKLGTPTKTLTWAPGANSSDVAYYEYAEYYNTAPTSETTPTNWLKTPIYGTSTTDTAWGSNIVIYWRVRAVDQAGNKSAWSDIGKIITDVDAPTVTVDPVASSEDTTPVITGTTSELGGDVTITVDGSDVATVTSDASGNWSWAVTTPLAVGSHIVLATAVDAAGNASNSDLTTPHGYWKQFTIQAPAVVQTTAVPTANVANNTGTTTQPVVTNAVTTTDGTGVLGTEDQAVNNSSVNTNDEDTNQVSAAGASDSKNDDGIWNLLGLAWYWWLLIIAAIAIVWGLLAARSRKRED